MPIQKSKIVKNIWPCFFLFLASVCWGLGTVFTKAMLSHLEPGCLLSTQLMASVLFLWSAVFFSEKKIKIKTKDIWVSATGLLEPGLAYAFAVTGLAWTTASKASLISTCEPLAILFLAVVFLKEKLSRTIVIASFLAMSGVLLVLGNDWRSLPEMQPGNTFLGDIFIGIGTLCAAIYVTVSHRLLQNTKPLVLVTLQQSWALILAIGFWATGFFHVLNISTEKALAVPSLSPQIWMQAGLSGIIQYALAFWFYMLGLKKMPASIAALFLTLVPFFGVLGSMLFLSEALTLIQALGAVLIIMGVLVSRLTE